MNENGMRSHWLNFLMKDKDCNLIGKIPLYDNDKKIDKKERNKVK